MEYFPQYMKLQHSTGLYQMYDLQKAQYMQELDLVVLAYMK